MEIARFLSVVLFGLALDLSVAWGATRFLDLPIWLAAAIGFIIAAAANYVLHEVWTFRSGTHSVSSARALRYCFALGITLATRVGSVAALASILNESLNIVALVAGAGISFCVHYLVSKYFVFSHPSDPEEPVQ